MSQCKIKVVKMFSIPQFLFLNSIMQFYVCMYLRLAICPVFS